MKMRQNRIDSIKRNKIIRVLAYPFEQTRRRLLVWEYQGSEDSLYIKSLKDIHKGESCFVIGNGPSLTAQDLDKLYFSGMSCFAANRIYKIYPQTKWRPMYYLSLDIDMLNANFEDIRCAGDYPKFINYKARKLGRKLDDNIHYLCWYADYGVVKDIVRAKSLNADVSKYATLNATVTVTSIELAIFMGFKTIYLLGVDNNYVHKRSADGTVYVDPTVKTSYFQNGDPNKEEQVSIQPVDFMNESYELAKKFAEERGVKIYNTTRGGKLEAFPRVDLDSLFKSI